MKAADASTGTAQIRANEATVLAQVVISSVTAFSSESA
jgi:hypothetical protein